MQAMVKAIKAHFIWKEHNELYRFVFYGVKAINVLEKAYCEEGLRTRFELIESIKEIMKLLTPNELIRIFPIEKIYDGKRWGSKDYYFTMEGSASLWP